MTAEGIVMDFRKASQSLMLSTGAGVRIAVLDSGINPAFPMLRRRLGRVFDCDEVSGEITITELPDGTNSDRSGHGSFVESCLLSVAPDAVIDHFRILGPANSASGSLLCYVLDHAIQRGYHIVHVSLGTRNEEHVPWLVSIMKRAYETETCLVAACSNIGSSLYPAWFTYAITCDAMVAPHPMHLRFNPRSIVEFSAFGVNVPMLDERGRTIPLTGSSYAAAHVTGLAARVVEILGMSSPLDVKLALREYAHQVGKMAS